MLVFVDESGDLGFKQQKGSSAYFTIALVVFDRVEAARSCQRALEELQQSLDMPAHYEFHFHDDSHQRRLAFLSVAAKQDFYCYTFTLDKFSPRLSGPGFRFRNSAYKWVCRTALENARTELKGATVVIDGSGERQFRREMVTYLRKKINQKGQRQIVRIKIGRSHSDPLLQLADYVAGITNRLYTGREGAETYDSFIRRKRRSQRKWP
jgi:hypothetical protein